MRRIDHPATADGEAPSRVSPGVAYRAGWWVLAVLTSLLMANHLLGFAVYARSDDEQTLFAIYAALGALSLVVLFIPYRRLERWSWWATWIPVVVTALLIVMFPFDVVTAFYAGVSAVMAVGRFLTFRAFGPSRLSPDVGAPAFRP
jgi:hypothetical protein